MIAYSQGAAAALHFYKVADLLFGTSAGRKAMRSVVRLTLGEDGRPRLIRTLEPYYEEFVEGDPTAFDRFDDRFREDNQSEK
jgi:hypothetical protein